MRRENEKAGITDALPSGRPVATAALVIALLAVSLAVLFSPGNNFSAKDIAAYAVVMRHYGVDAREMERTVAVPLEDALASLPGLKGMVSSSENNQVRVFVSFNNASAGLYETLREAVQGVYEKLPPSIQRPEIFSSDDSRIPVWSAAVIPRGELPVPLGKFLERSVKPGLEALEGAGEVEVSGAGLNEITITLKPEAAAARGITSGSLATFLAGTDLLLSGGEFTENGRSLPVFVDGRYSGLEELAKAFLPLENGAFTALEDVALIREQEREADSLSRLDGKRTAFISVMGNKDGDLKKLSECIDRELGRFRELPLDFFVISNRGAEEALAYRSVFGAALQGALAVALAAAFLSRGRSPLTALIPAAAVPLMLVFSAALLRVIGFPPDRTILAGLAAGSGAAVDAAIISAGVLGNIGDPAERRRAMKKLRPSLLSGAFTTMAALIPLYGPEIAAKEMRPLALAIAAVTLSALLCALFLLPPFFSFKWKFCRTDFFTSKTKYIRGTVSGEKVFRVTEKCRLFLSGKIKRNTERIISGCVSLSCGKPVFVVVFWLAVSAGGLAFVIFGGVDVSELPSADSVYAQAEFDAGILAEETDRRMVHYAAALRKEAGIRGVQTIARTSSASILISFDPKKTNTEKVHSLARSIQIPGAFIYINESSASYRTWEIKISGDDDRRCREYAAELARIFSSHPLVRETILNFKEGNRRFALKPNQERLAALELTFSYVGDLLRRAVHGPVAYKRVGGEGETDVRVKGGLSYMPSWKDVQDLLIPHADSAESLQALVNIREEREVSVIRRENRRRTASFSIQTRPMDPRRIRDSVMKLADEYELPAGYTVEFDPLAIRKAETLSASALLLALAVLLCYLVLGAAHESFLLPFGVLPVIPPSLAVPVFFLFGFQGGLRAETAAAFIAVSGLAVNAAVLIAGDLHFASGSGTGALSRCLRGKFPVLISTTLTTILGSLPFILLNEGSNFLVRALAAVSALGVSASLLCSFTLLPALAVLFPKIFRKNSFL